MKIKPFKVVVKKKHIKRGVRECTNQCPIALAIREYKHTSLDNISVDDKEAEVNGNYYKLPDEASDFVCDFDSNLPVKPFSFTLIPIEEEL